MRSVRKNGKLTRSSHKGTPFSELWNEIMGSCSGFHASNVRFDSVTRLTSYQESQFARLPCYPSTVVYGHAAGRGLDVKRWSVGLDTGCSYGRRLSALVLGAKSFSSGVSDDHSLDFLPEETNRFDAGPLFSETGEYHKFYSLSDATDHRIKFDHAGESRIFSVKSLTPGHASFLAIVPLISVGRPMQCHPPLPLAALLHILYFGISGITKPALVANANIAIVV